MAQPAPNPAVTSNLLSTQGALITTITSFLCVAVHHILFLRHIYPPVSFLSTRAYNYPVRQNRHPAVCQWVLSALDAIADQLGKGTVDKVAMCIFECDDNQVLERWTFDLRALPVVDRKDADTMFEERGADSGQAAAGEDTPLKRKLNIADLEAQFRAVLARLNVASGRLKPLPKDRELSFALTIDVKESADRPVGRLEKEERKWVAAEPDSFASDEEQDVDGQPRKKKAGPHGMTVPVRRLEAGELRMEVWVEESKTKLELSSRATGSTQTSTSS